MSNWMQTASGRVFNPQHPTAESIVLEDIAHALSHLCRFAGHTHGFYSVAQHSVLVSEALQDEGYDEEVVRAGLLHDAAEAYLVDLPSPVKALVRGYVELENELELVIARKFGVDFLLMKGEAVKRADMALLATEARDLLGPPPQPWSGLPKPLKSTIIPWQPPEARRRFLMRYRQLFVVAS